MDLLPLYGLPELDEICTKILAAFFLERLTFRYLEFHRYLESKGLKISKPTLSKHLNHLVDSELVVREEISRQHITYRFNWEKWGDIDIKLSYSTKFRKLIEKEIEEYNNEPVLTQVNYLHNVMITTNLLSLREMLLKFIRPESEFQSNLNLIQYANIWQKYIDMIIKNCEEKGEEYIQELLESLEKLFQIYMEKITSLSNSEIT